MENERTARAFFFGFLASCFLVLAACLLFPLFLIQSFEGISLLVPFVLLMILFFLAILLGAYTMRKHFIEAPKELSPAVYNEMRRFAYGRLSLAAGVLLAVVAAFALLGLVTTDRIFFSLAAALAIAGVLLAVLLRVLFRKPKV